MSGGVVFVAGEAYLLRGILPEELSWVRSTDASGTCAVRLEAIEGPLGAGCTEGARQPHGARETGSSGRPAAGLARLDSGEWRIADEGVEAIVSRDLARVRLSGERAALATGVRSAARVVAILRCIARGGVVLHASGVELARRAVLFAGRTGCGKTTAASRACEALGARGLADDTAFVQRVGAGAASRWVASGFPWEPCSSGEAVPLAAVVRLEQGRELRVERLAGARAAAALVELPAPALFAETDPARGDEHRPICAPRPGSPLAAVYPAETALDRARLLAARVAVFRAELPPGPEAVGSLLKEVLVGSSETVGA